MIGVTIARASLQSRPDGESRCTSSRTGTRLVAKSRGAGMQSRDAARYPDIDAAIAGLARADLYRRVPLVQAYPPSLART
jgi:hypothetical protein